MSQWFIYGLAEPEDRPEPGLIRYVGKTERTPEMRFRQHLKDSVRHETHLGAWLRKLRSQRLAPELIILE